MARTVLLATTTRRQGLSFQLKTAGNQVIGTMVLNPSVARHEMELSEPDFLKHSKELARLCAVPGLGWYVVEFRNTRDKSKLPPSLTSLDGKHYESATGPSALTDDLAGKPFFALRKIAKDLDVDVSRIKGNEPMKAAIRAARIAKSA